MSSGEAIHKKTFTEIGELLDTPEYGLVIQLTFGKALKRIVGYLIGEKLEVGFKKLRYQRSGSQNRFLWGVAYVCISAWYKESQGVIISKDAIHAHTLQEILDYKITAKEMFGTEVLVVEGKSTSQLDTKRFAELVDKLQIFWAKKGCVIPDPRQNNFLSDYIEDK